MTSSVLDVQIERLRSMTPEEKIRASEALRDAAWAFKAAWIRSRRLDLSEAEIQDAVRCWFLKTDVDRLNSEVDAIALRFRNEL